MARVDSGTWLVVGGDGLIGRALVSRARGEGRTVLATTRRRNQAGAARPYLELAQNPASWVLPQDVSVAFVLAAAADQASCCADPEVSRRVNVDHTAELARRLAAQGAFVVFTSTNLVFDGADAAYPTCASPAPVGEYGRQKAAAERLLLALGASVAVVRLTKVLSAELPLIGGWVDALRRREPVDAFTDLVCAPMPVAFVAEALLRIGEARRGGLFHLSGADEVTYADLARALARRLGADEQLVRPTTSVAAGIRLPHLPKHSSLDAEGVASLFQLRPPSIDAVLDACVPR